MENIDNNTLLQEDSDIEHPEFEYNFISIPWDDRSKTSKIGIVVLLLGILFAIMACVINSFTMHYRGFSTTAKTGDGHTEMNCQLVKVEDYRYVARIHSMSTLEILCVGGVVSSRSVIANGACIKNGQVRLYVGSPDDLYCKKGFTVNVAEPIFFDGVIAKTLVLLSTDDNMAKCIDIISIAPTITEKVRGFVIGRSVQNGKTILSRQPVTVVGKNCSCYAAKNHQGHVICVESMARCPVLAGDLLVHNNFLLGLASTSVYRKGRIGQVCFASLVEMGLKELDTMVL